ncbi:ATP-binding protein [Fuchsiella alkaliacetigena]|uniref:ATP-binding protein n=1 Tax=Fuchsiella alkaliacetigena TaxID=957042 RepID=UPI00200AD309|nr:ATP-binding protein [Fuchsiella alkaliacetigena]MCK8824493.1 ATP-binding protein [Fuchsiella alkaliacetigena]
MQVVGLTTQQEVYVASKERKFRSNEILKILDSELDNPLGEVVETQSYNRFIPLSIKDSFVDKGVLESLRSIGYNVDEDEINIAKVRLLTEATYPIKTGVAAEVPAFTEVKELLVKESPAEGLVLGVIKGTEEMAAGMDDDLKDVAPLLKGKEVVAQQGVPFNFKLKAMHQYPHIGIIGGSGSGKSFGMRVMLEELMKLEIPTLVFDPHFEMDFSEKFPDLPTEYEEDFESKFEIFQVGRQVGVNFEDLSTKDLLDLLSAASDLSESMVNAVETLHNAEAKRDSFFTFAERLADLRQALELGRKRIQRKLKSGELSGQQKEEYQHYLALIDDYGSLHLSSITGLTWRLNKLKRHGLFQQSISEIEAALQSRKLVVVQGPIWLLQVFATYLLGNLYRQRRDYKDADYSGETADYFPPFLVATDEAHNFAPKGYDSPTKRVLKEISQEGRKYGVFLILATQRPTLLADTVTAQLNSKFVFRTVRASDIETIKQETDLTAEEAKRLPYLSSGDAFVSSAIFGRTMAVRIRVAKTTSPHTQNPFDELEAKTKAKEDELYGAIAKHLPIYDDDMLTELKAVNKELEGKMLSRNQLQDRLETLVERGRLKKEDSPLGGTVYNLG